MPRYAHLRLELQSDDMIVGKVDVLGVLAKALLNDMPGTVDGLSATKTKCIAGIAQRSSSCGSRSVVERMIRPRVAYENGESSPSTEA